MKAITVRQPYAWAIVHGIKDVENRTRNIVGKHRGPLLIHAAKMGATFSAKHPELWPFDERHTTGAIVGMVEVWDVHQLATWSERWSATQQRDVTCSPWAERPEPGEVIYHIELTDAMALVDPIPWRGRLGMWDYDGPLPGFWESGAWIRGARR